jgi:serine/threonine protein kinase
MTNSRNINSKKNKKNKIKGGKVIASGGFGCVFTPALKCRGSNKREVGKITKLMKEKYALQEYKEINNFKNKLDNIPDYKNYFLLDNITLCQPDKLSREDLLKYSKKCKALPKDKITKDNINENLDKIMALNMPEGGIPVDDYLYENGSFKKMALLNKKLKELLRNGIIPMNERHIYHCDLKDSNILVKSVNENNKEDIKTRIIDWGLATEYIPHKEEAFPSTLRNKPLQFNLPFSVIIFTDSFINKYTEYIKNGGKIDHDSLKPFVLNYLHFWIHYRGPGHYKLINEIMYILFSNELKNLNENDKKTIIETEFTIPYIVNYIIEILIHFTEFRENGTLNLRIYLDNVFIKIIDIWGFISVYFPFLEILYTNYDDLSSNQILLFELLKTIYIDFLYKPRIREINMDDLYKDLEKVDKLLIHIINENEINEGVLESVDQVLKHSKSKTTPSNKSIFTSKLFKRSPKSKTRKFKKNNLLMLSKK